MRKISFVFIFLICGLAVSAQQVRLRPAGPGKVSVMRGKLRSIIDLSKEVAGCPYVPASARRADKRGCSAPPATFDLIDATVKDGQIYLVVRSEAAGSCNVCGQCGASESYALIWLKLDSRLKVLSKKNVPVDYCLDHITAVEADPPANDNAVANDNDSAPKPVFKKDIVTFEYEKTLFNQNSDISGYEFSHLEYNRKTPEKGFIIKTEKRDKSSAN